MNTIGPIEDASGTPLRVNDLATQPGTDVLFGSVGGVSVGPALYTINKTTAVATLVGPIVQRGGVAFAPDGTLFLATVPNARLYQLDPATAMTIGMPLTLGTCVDGLAVRPSDGQLFATECDGNDTLLIDKATGDTTSLPDDDDDTTDLAFAIAGRAAAPSMSAIGLGIVAASLAAFGIRRLGA